MGIPVGDESSFSMACHSAGHGSPCTLPKAELQPLLKCTYIFPSSRAREDSSRTNVFCSLNEVTVQFMIYREYNHQECQVLVFSMSLLPYHVPCHYVGFPFREFAIRVQPKDLVIIISIKVCTYNYNNNYTFLLSSTLYSLNFFFSQRTAVSIFAGSCASISISCVAND